MNKKTILEISLYAQYYKKDITDRYMINNKSLIITNDAIDILDKPQETLYIEPWTKKIEQDKEIEELKKPLIPSEITELVSLLYKEHLSNKNKKRLEDYITRLHNYNDHLLKTVVEKDYKLVEIENEIDKVKNADMTSGNLYTLIDKLENILDLDIPQENLYRYTPEKGFELVGDNEDVNTTN